MTTPKRHHYIPQMILNGFTDQEGCLHWCRLDERTPTIRKARPSTLFLENHLYSTISETGTRNPRMETALSILESEVVPIINIFRDSARSRQCPNLSTSQKDAWYRFFLTQWRRTPETQQAVASDADATDALDTILAELRANHPLRNREVDILSTPEAKARMLHNVRVDSIEQLSDNVMHVLEARGITVLGITNPRKSFIIGSRPVVKLTIAGQSDLRNPIVEMWLPIASNVAVGVGRGDGRVNLHLLAGDQPVRQLNTAIASQSRVIAAGSAALVRSIANRR